MSNRISHRRDRQQGFSLVELMLALMLGLVVITGIVQLFITNSQTNNVLSGQARMYDNARFALDIISRAARNAGYFGCSSSPANMVWALTGGTAANADQAPEFDVTRPVQGINNVAGAASLAAFPTQSANSFSGAAGGIDAGAVALGTDVLAVRSMETPGIRLMEEMFPTGANNTPRVADSTDIVAGDIVVVSNCEQSAVFRVTGVTAAGAGVVSLDHAVTGGDAFQNSGVANWSAIGRTYQVDSLVGRIESSFFFIAPSEVGVDNLGNPTMSLWRKVGVAAPVEMVEGVEDLQVLYGVDTTLADGIPNANRYVTANALDPNDADVVSLRVAVTVNSIDTVADDGTALQRTFSRTILLRNADPEAV